VFYSSLNRLFDLLLEDSLSSSSETPFAQARSLLFLQTAYDELSWRGEKELHDYLILTI
jgi:hypothetical protein